MSCYHVAIEMFNIINNASSDSLQRKMRIEPRGYNLRCLEDGKVRVPDKGKKSCTGFSYYGPKFWNYLPSDIRTTEKREIFKQKNKDWIWSNIPQSKSKLINLRAKRGGSLFETRSERESNGGSPPFRNGAPKKR